MKHKIIFVGVHFKEGMKALDSRTLTGKTIDSIIEKLDQFECVKTNLFPGTSFPDNEEIEGLFQEWYGKNIHSGYEVVVTLGKRVKEVFENQYYNMFFVHLSHPGRPIKNREEYILHSIKSIKEVAGCAMIEKINPPALPW